MDAKKVKKGVFLTAAAGLLGFGVAKGVQKTPRAEEDEKQDDVEVAAQPETKKSPQTYTERAMQELYPELVVGIEFMETNRETPIQQSKESRCTYWNGLTWVYTRNSDGKIVQHACLGKWKDYAARLDAEQRYEQFRMHLEFEVFAKLKSVTADKKLNHNEQVALCLAGYQLSAKMDIIATKLNEATNIQQKMDAFKYGPAPLSWRAGSYKRRWWCGAYANGLISYDDFMSLKKDGYSAISLDKVATGVARNKLRQVVSIGHFKYDAATIAYALQTARDANRTTIVRDAVKKTKSGRDALASLSDGKTITFAAARQDMYQQQYETALAEFKSGKYKSAKKGFEKILSEHPDDALVWNDLAATYNNLGEYDSAILCVHEITRKIGDKSQYAAAYYNAGASYEAKGDTERALKNYRLAITHGNKSKDAAAALTRMERATKSKSKVQAYNAGTKKLNARTKNRSTVQNARNMNKKTRM